MAKFYAEQSSQNLKEMRPKKETVKFLLNYSKALRVERYRNLQFENVIN